MAVERKKARRKGKSHKYKDRNKRPSRDRYWSDGRLEKKKIANLIRYCKLSPSQAYVRWHDTRKGRMR